MNRPERKKYDISASLRRALGLKGVSVSELSRRTHINKSMLSKYLSNERHPSYQSILRIAEAIEIDPDYLTDPETAAVSKETGIETCEAAIKKIQDEMNKIIDLPENQENLQILMDANTLLNQTADRIERLRTENTEEKENN
jgi:transcriptional regulator with XRE-family HTH domain